MGLSVAKREQLLGAIAIMGASGSGKTLGGLLMAYGMMKEKYQDLPDNEVWQKVGLIDTEHRRSLVYVNMEHQGTKIGEFWHFNLEAPYSVDRYDESMGALKSAGCEVIVIDSTSHAWEGEGGVMNYQQQLGGRFQDWLTTNKEAYDPMVKLFTGEKHGVHVINTMRTKQEHVMQPDENGKMQVVKLGMKPIQRDSLEYEFQVVFSVDMEHTAVTSKDNSSMFAGQRFQLSADIGKKLYQWLGAGVDIQEEKREKARQEEESRVNYAKTLRAAVTDNNLTEWFKATYEDHKTIAKPLEDFPMDFLIKVAPLIEQQAKKSAEETAKGDNQ